MAKPIGVNPRNGELVYVIPASGYFSNGVHVSKMKPYLEKTVKAKPKAVISDEKPLKPKAKRSKKKNKKESI